MEQSPTWRGHLQICRVDHWFKNVFVLPGIFVALALEPQPARGGLLWRVLAGLLSVCLIASSNYVINELQDAGSDHNHPIKRTRPVPSRRVHVPLAYGQWILLLLAGLGAATSVSRAFQLTMVALWAMGCVYNIPPLRSKDVPYVDVLSEAVNNPLRMLAGWYVVGPAAVLPGSLLLSYWMIGAYFMAVKRLAEYRYIGDAAVAAAYRKSFASYNEVRLLISVMFYGSAAMLLLGAFIVRYRLELILGVPLVALIMAIYLQVGLKENSPAQRPERLYREPYLMAAVVVCSIVMLVCLFVDLPGLHKFFAPSAPTACE